MGQKEDTIFCYLAHPLQWGFLLSPFKERMHVNGERIGYLCGAVALA